MRFVQVILTAAIAPLQLAAQDGLGLQDAIQQALRRHPAITAAREQVVGAQQLTLQAGFRPNPRLYLQSENARAWGGPGFAYGREADTFAYFSQTIETAGKRARRSEIAAAGVERSRAEQTLLERQIAARVALAYWSAVGAQTARDLLEQELATLTRVVDYTRSRVQEGAAAGADLLRMELEHQRVESLLNTAIQDAASARIQLFREMGSESFPEVRLTEDPTRIDAASFPPLAEALRNRPEVLAAERAVEQACATVRLQQANARPDVEVIFGYKRTIGFNTVLAGVQTPLAIFNRNQGQIGAAAAAVNAARANLRSVENQVRAEWTAARNQYELRRALVSQSLPEMVRRAGELARIAEGTYREGGADVLRLLDSQRAHIEINLQYNRALIEYQQSVVNFKIAAGVNP